jgi:hypothetical protein
MNQFFYEARGREKVRELMKEGMNSQEYSRSRTSKNGSLRGLTRLIVFLLGALGVLQLIIR